MTDLNTPEEDDGELSLWDILGQLYAWKWIILAITFLGASIGWFYGQLAPDIYRAQATVFIEQRSQADTILPEELTGARALGSIAAFEGLQTETHIIRSSLTLRPVVVDLNLNWRVEPARFPVVGDLVERRRIPFLPDTFLPAYVRKGDRMELAALQVPNSRFNTPITVTALGDGQFRATLPDGVSADGRVGAPVALGETGISLTLQLLNAPAGRQFTVWRTGVDRQIAEIRRGITVSERRGSSIADFRYTTTDRHRAAEIVNAVVKSYQNQNLSRRSAEFDQAIAFIEEEMPKVVSDLDAATTALRDYRADQQETSLSLGTQNLLSQAVALEAQLDELKFQETQLAERVTPNHPDYRTLIAQKERLEARLAELQAEIGDLPDSEQELLELTQRVEAARQIEQTMSTRLDQLRIRKAGTISNIQMLETARNATRIGPNRRMPMLQGAIAALLLACAASVLVHFLRRGIDSASEIEALGLPLFATVPRIKSLAFASTRSATARATYALAQSEPDHLAVEALRGLRTGLQFSLATAKAPSLMLTSCAPSDGKSFIALNLATVWGQSGEKVLLVDGDMRRGVLRRYFDLPHKPPGLSDLLAGKADMEAVLHKDAGKMIDFIPAGSYPPNPSELLGAKPFRQFMEEAGEIYDLVIIDAPPALAVTDPGIIGQHAGMSLMVIRANAPRP